MFTKKELTDLICTKLLKIMFFGRKDTLDSWVDFWNGLRILLARNIA